MRLGPLFTGSISPSVTQAGAAHPSVNLAAEVSIWGVPMSRAAVAVLGVTGVPARLTGVEAGVGQVRRMSRAARFPDRWAPWTVLNHWGSVASPAKYSRSSMGVARVSRMRGSLPRALKE